MEEESLPSNTWIGSEITHMPQPHGSKMDR